MHGEHAMVERENYMTVNGSLKVEDADGMRIEWDAPIVMDDGVTLRADVYRPPASGPDHRVPAIMSMGPYGKNLRFQDAPYTVLWDAMCEKYPDVPRGSTNKYQGWEIADPEKWVPHDYAVVRVDSRGAGRSEGFMDCFSAREIRDYHDAIEWAAAQPWCNGKIGLLGISYYAITQWRVAALNPPHLAAICPWEGANSWYRDAAYHGGIYSDFLERWFPLQCKEVQYGLGSRGKKDRTTGMWVSGDIDLTDEQLTANRAEMGRELREHRLDDEWFAERTADLSQVRVPVLSCGNWGGQGLHNRGNVRGFMQAASTEKYLEMHGLEHWTLFYTDWGVNLQRRFFDHYLKGQGDWKETAAPVQLQVRYAGEKFVQRDEQEFPLARTKWTKLYLDNNGDSLTWETPTVEAAQEYRAFGDGITYFTPAFEEPTEITGPMACRLWLSNSTEDTDVFLALRLFDPAGNEVTWHGANEPKAPISLGWLRASHRKLDLEMSEPWMPYHPHQEREPMVPGEVYPLDVEIWTASCVIEPGYRLALSVLGRDFDHGLGSSPSHIGIEMHGSGLWNHAVPEDRPAEIYDGDVTVYTGGARSSHLLLPVIPAER
jgi:predicted acyl esterase